MKTVKRYLPGCALALVIAAAAKLLERLENAAGLHLIGASVIALFIGMLVNHFYPPNEATKPGIRFTSKKILKFAIILLGASLNIRTVLTVGRFSLTVMVFTLATCFGLGALIGKALGLNWKTSSLINAGTGICGGSAIAAIGVHKKKKEDAGQSAAVRVNMKSVFPWFILGFLAMSALCSLGVIPAALAAGLKSASKFLMVAALAAIGLNTNFKELCRSGAKPMLHGFIISLLVVLVAIAVEYAIGVAPTGTLG